MKEDEIHLFENHATPSVISTTINQDDNNRPKFSGKWYTQAAVLLSRGAVGLLILLAFLYTGEITRKVLWLPLPGPVIGFAFLAVALQAAEQFLFTGYRPIIRSLAPVTRLLLSHMGLLFIPAGVGIINEGAVLRREWLPILAALLGSTILGLAATGWFMHRHQPKEENQNQ